MGNRSGLGQAKDQAKIETGRIKPDFLVGREGGSPTSPLSRPRVE